MIGRLLRGLVLSRINTPRDAARWAFRRHRGKSALALPSGRELGFAELGRRVFSLAAGLLKSGLRPGDRVAFTLPNSLEFVELRLACHEAGLVAVPLIWDLPPQTRAKALSAAHPGLYVYDPELDATPPGEIARKVALSSGDGSGIEALRADATAPCAVKLDPDSPATINFTSGTTGDPKGVVSTHAAWATSLKMTVNSSLLSVEEDDIFLHAIPFATAGWGAVLPCLLGGITGLLPGAWDAQRALELVEARPVTRTFLTPSMLIDWLDLPALESCDTSSLRAIICGTAALHGPKAAEALERIGPVLYQGYGLAEVLPPLAALTPAEHNSENFPLRVGRPAAGVEVRVVDGDGAQVPAGSRGQIEVKSPTQTPGYWQRPDLTAAAVPDGFFRTGDLGFLDEEGFLNVEGRAADSIPQLAVHPRRLEERAHALPGVKESAVVLLDGEPVLCCSLRADSSASVGEISDLLTRDFADLPDLKISVLETDLPRSAAGKIVRRELANRITLTA